MLDVHPPHEPVHGWRDFLLHILTITIGLLIALALEAGVEAIHHRHIVAEARENIRRETENNRKLIAADRVAIDVEGRRAEANMVALRALRDNPNAKVKLSSGWTWSAPSNSAWLTARDSGALTYMDQTAVQGYAELYSHQQLVADEATLLIRSQTRALVPVTIEVDPKSASPSEIDEALHHCGEILVQLQLLKDLITGLDGSYTRTLQHG